jgi:hypothetical protein
MIIRCAAQSSGLPLQETAAAANLLKTLNNVCEWGKHNQDPGAVKLSTDPRMRFVYVLSGKSYSQEEWAEMARNSIHVGECSQDNLQVTFLGTFPSTAVVTYRTQHSEKKGRKTRIFSAYAKHTFEYIDSVWVIRRLEASVAR